MTFAALSHKDSNSRVQGNRVIGGDWREWSALAVTEACAILDQTEPGTEGWGLLPFPTAHPFIARDGSGRLCGGGLDTEARTRLAAWLTAVLPVLTALEQEAR